MWHPFSNASGVTDLRQETEDYYISYTLDRVLNGLYAQVKLVLGL